MEQYPSTMLFIAVFNVGFSLKEQTRVVSCSSIEIRMHVSCLPVHISARHL